GARLIDECFGPPWVTVAERNDRVAPIEIEHPLANTVSEPDALGGHDLDRILREYGRQKVMRRRRSCVVVHDISCQVHPGAGAVRPEVSGKSNIRFIHCTAPPAAPLLRLSTTHITATVRPFATAERCA